MAEPTRGKRILVVEDDESITLGLQMNLEAEGYAVTVAVDGEEALGQVRESPPSLVILDVMLPRVNGFEVLRRLRNDGFRMPVIMLSARGAELDKVMGLELGAEDYITKPFGLAELLARVKAVLRRDAMGRAEATEIVRAGAIEIDTAARRVTVSGSSVPLTATEFDVLMALVEARGRVLSREQILAKVWGPSHHGTLRTIDNFVLQLRNKLEADPAEPRHLVTVRGVGYRFEA
jgi:DNA-binding response OmpR family regulator